MRSESNPFKKRMIYFLKQATWKKLYIQEFCFIVNILSKFLWLFELYVYKKKSLQTELYFITTVVRYYNLRIVIIKIFYSCIDDY